MNRLPAPATLLDDPPVRVIQARQQLVRFYRPEHGPWDSQRELGPLSTARFDHHRPPLGSDRERSVWYAARSLVGATAEAFGDLGFVDKSTGRRVAVVRVRSSLRLVELAGTAARAFGLDQRIGTSTDYEVCQAWARAFYDRYPDFAGIHWRGRQAGSLCAVLTDHADMTKLDLVADADISEPAVWPRIARAARNCRFRILDQ
ncbi:MAG: RES family NAD+ phosphorylase [Thermoanaerobaculia bacterium]